MVQKMPNKQTFIEWFSQFMKEMAEIINSDSLDNLKTELIQLATVCLAWHSSLQNQTDLHGNIS
jgi:hypothetical protein